MKEKTIEQTLARAAKARGGWALKLTCPGTAGVPDRLVLMPGGHVGFVELKAPGRRMRPLQLRRRAQLEALGFHVWCVDGTGRIGPVLDAIQGVGGSTAMGGEA